MSTSPPVVADRTAERQLGQVDRRLEHGERVKHPGAASAASDDHPPGWLNRSRPRALATSGAYCVLGSVDHDVDGESIPYVAGCGEDGALDAIREYARQSTGSRAASKTRSSPSPGRQPTASLPKKPYSSQCVDSLSELRATHWRPAARSSLLTEAQGGACCRPTRLRLPTTSAGECDSPAGGAPALMVPLKGGYGHRGGSSVPRGVGSAGRCGVQRGTLCERWMRDWTSPRSSSPWSTAPMA